MMKKAFLMTTSTPSQKHDRELVVLEIVEHGTREVLFRSAVSRPKMVGPMRLDDKHMRRVRNEAVRFCLKNGIELTNAPEAAIETKREISRVEDELIARKRAAFERTEGGAR
jgi:hypothetical protein